MTEIFKFKDHSYDLRNNNCLERLIIKSCKYGSETVSNLGAKLWDILPETIKKAETLQDFKKKTKSWTPLNCPCKLCKTYIASVDYVLVFSFMRFQFPNLLNVSTYHSITSVMVQLLFC